MHPFRALRAAAIHTYAKTLSYLGRLPGLQVCWRFIPAGEVTWPRSKTSRMLYEFERREFRDRNFLIRSNEPLLTRREYYIYRNIALKYRWPYIKEIYDDDEDACYHIPTWQLLEHVVWWRRMSSIVWRAFLILMLIALGNMAVETDFASTSQKLSSMFGFAVVLLIAAWVLLLPFRLIARIQVLIRSKDR